MTPNQEAQPAKGAGMRATTEAQLPTHAETVKRYAVPGTCKVRIADWPYDCDAKHKHPEHVVFVCETHRVWWHEADWQPADVPARATPTK